MQQFERQCQSCGMPLNGGKRSGTEKDGSKSLMYCELCYTDGKFITPEMTLDEMKVVIDNALKAKGGIWSFTPMRSMAKMQLPKLGRWKKK